MVFIDKDGGRFYIVPDCAFCTLAEEPLMEMDECPFKINACDGDACKPYDCEYYEERWEQEAAAEDAQDTIPVQSGAEHDMQ